MCCFITCASVGTIPSNWYVVLRTVIITSAMGTVNIRTLGRVVRGRRKDRVLGGEERWVVRGMRESGERWVVRAMRESGERRGGGEREEEG